MCWFDSLLLTRVIQSHGYDKVISIGIITEIKNKVIRSGIVIWWLML
jgi:hypothetical protein